ncbi:MAG: hypothetical protein HYS76_00580, partial [Candidatus Wildermuthbacteria bacterium]|nr:hypothetical protein [Candidatus Wildermuthbacteria bacterium]
MYGSMRTTLPTKIEGPTILPNGGISLTGMECMISLNDFKAIDLKVATIVEAECVEGSDKLVKLQIDLGQERRQILAGIGKHYGPEELVG